MTDVRPATRFIRVDFPVAGRDGVALVTIDRPEARNALSFDLLDQLASALADLDTGGDVDGGSMTLPLAKWSAF